MKAYERSLLMLMNSVIYGLYTPEELGQVVAFFAIDHGIYFEITGSMKPDDEFIARVDEGMRKRIAQDIHFVKKQYRTDDTRNYFSERGFVDKEKLLRYRRTSRVNLYCLDGYMDYYYGRMVPSTGYLRYFELQLFGDGFVLRYPDRTDPEKVPPFNPPKKLFRLLLDTERWGDRMGMASVGQINDVIASGRGKELILISEARQEGQLAEIAAAIAADPRKKIILIAGPSSSGKTTFSHRLAIQLSAQGLTPRTIGVDDYFVDRQYTPIDEDGNLDFESLDCVDTDQFNLDMRSLLAGEEVDLPTFNFKQGKREYHGRRMRLDEKDVLLIEGIHCLNPELTRDLPDKNKFRIYISALTQINIDSHNRIPTTDARLLRRLVRDAMTRGTTAEETIARWPSVRRGEEKNIFPYQESADVMFNSTLTYEFSVLKSAAEQMLFGISEDSPQCPEAKRLLKFLDYFLSIDSTWVPMNSVIREFIGGSCFNV
jgi:uridine kinase